MAIVVACALLAVGSAIAAPEKAFAASPKIIAPSKAKNTAYKRCVKAAMNYKKQPQTITVNIKDLKLTKKQVIDVETLVHSNGELWWINTFALGLSTSKITMPCKYDDATITSMRKRFDAACNKALKRIGPGMAASTKVHMLHDYLVRKVVYEDQAKNAYEALVNKHADCFGYTLATDVLMRRAGFKTDVAFNNDPDKDHSWNLVCLGKKWYHVDTTWDRWSTYTNYGGKKISHFWLLQSDKSLNQDDHRGWEAHHRCTDSKWDGMTYMGGYFSKHCNDYKNIVRSFYKGGLKYTVTGIGKVSVSAVAKAKQSAKTLAIPATVKHKKVKYTVTGLSASAFKKASAKVLVVNSTSFTKARVKNSLAGSKVKTVKVPKKKLKAYKAYFAKSNSGKKVKVIGLSSGAMNKAILKAQMTPSLNAATVQSTRLQAASWS